MNDIQTIIGSFIIGAIIAFALVLWVNYKVDRIMKNRIGKVIK